MAFTLDSVSHSSAYRYNNGKFIFKIKSIGILNDF